MRIYIKSYAHRAKEISIIVLCVVVLMGICCAMFQGKLNKVGGQLETYRDSSYETIYILNYEANLENICVYPDADIMMFQQSESSNRIAVSVVMKSDRANYTLPEIEFLNSLSSAEAVVSWNVADRYSISIGDTLFAEYSYNQQRIPITVVGVGATEFDYQNPNIGNDIGIIYIGNDNGYVENTRAKYICFADHSLASELNEYPQIIYRIVSKQSNAQSVISQGYAAFIFQALFTIAVVLISHLFFFRKSIPILKRCIIKGMSARSLLFVPFVERFAFLMLPCGIVQMFMLRYILCQSTETVVYVMIPIVLIAVYCICSVVVGMRYIKSRKG